MRTEAIVRIDNAHAMSVVWGFTDSEGVRSERSLADYSERRQKSSGPINDGDHGEALWPDFNSQFDSFLRASVPTFGLRSIAPPRHGERGEMAS